MSLDLMGALSSDAKRIAIHVEGVTRNYFRENKGRNYFSAVEDVNLELKSGMLTSITGRSGSGKSTLLNMMGGLLEPTEGQILISLSKSKSGPESKSESESESEPEPESESETLRDEQQYINLYELSDDDRSKFRNSHIGIIPQGQTALHSLTVLENVLLPYKMYGGIEANKRGISEEKSDGIPGLDSVREKGIELLERVGLGALMDVYPNELSGGEMRRLAVARAIIMDSEIILADEPTGDLDDDNTAIVLTLLKELAESGKAVMLVTHEKEAENYADIGYYMDAGKLSRK